MKKIGVLIIVLLLMGIISPLILALEDVTDSGLPKELETVQKTADKANDVLANRNQSAWKMTFDLYWDKFTSTNIGKVVGKVLAMIVSIIKPVLLFIVKVEPGFTWTFAIAIAILTGLLFVVSTGVEFLPFSKVTSWIIGASLVIAFSVMGGAAKIATSLVSVSEKWWGKLIISTVVVLMICLSMILSKVAEKQKEKNKKIQEDLDREKLHEQVKVTEEFNKEITK